MLDLKDELNSELVEQFLSIEGIQEGMTLEFKQTKPTTKNLPKAVSAMANAEGGTILFGVSQGKNTGKICVIGLDIESIDKEMQTFDSIIASNISPRITKVKRDILQVDGKTIVVVRVPSSSNRPHMDTSRSIYYVRNGQQSLPMSADQVRLSILETEDSMKQWNEEYKESFLAIKHAEFESSTSQRTRVNVIALPLGKSANSRIGIFDDLEPILTIVEDALANDHTTLGRVSVFPNVDGVIGYRGLAESPHEFEHIQVHWNGMIENCYNPENTPFPFEPGADGEVLSGEQFRHEFKRTFELTKDVFEVLKVNATTHLTANLHNVKGWRLRAGGRTSAAIQQDNVRLSLSEVVEFSEEWEMASKRVLKHLACSFGLRDF